MGRLTVCAVIWLGFSGALGCAKKASPDAKLLVLRDDMCACESRPCSTEVETRFEVWREETGAADNLSDATLQVIGAYFLCRQLHPPFEPRRDSSDEECVSLGRKVAPFLWTSSDTREQSTLRQLVVRACERYWGDSTRDCMGEVGSLEAVLMCRRKGVESECSELYDHLGELVAAAKLVDPSLPSKRASLEAICRDSIFPSMRTCMLDSETFDELKECVAGSDVDRLLASPALEWKAEPIEGDDEWQLHTGFAGVREDAQAMKLASAVIKRDGMSVQPLVFITCQGEYLGVHLDSRNLRTREIRLPPEGEPEVTLRLEIDEGPTTEWSGFTVQRGLVGVGEPKKLIEALRDAKRLTWELDETTPVRFELDNLDEILGKFESCLGDAQDSAK